VGIGYKSINSPFGDVFVDGMYIIISSLSKKVTFFQQRVEFGSKTEELLAKISPSLADVKKQVVQAAHITCLDNLSQVVLAIRWPNSKRVEIFIALRVFLGSALHLPPLSVTYL
jgi:hypothetical protein